MSLWFKGPVARAGWFHVTEGKRRSRTGRSASVRRRNRFANSPGTIERLEERRLLAIDTARPGVAANSAADVAKASLVQQQYAQLPLSFEANYGQTDNQVDFLA